MLTGRDLLLWLAGFVALGLIIRAFGARGSTGPQRVQEEHRAPVGMPAIAYFIGLAFLVATPALSGMLAAQLKLKPLLAYGFLFVGVGVLISFAIPLVLCRSLSKQHYEDYWVYIIEGSGVSRKNIVWTAVGAALFVFAAGAAMLIFEDA